MHILVSKEYMLIISHSNISDQGFDLSLQGALTGTGPLDALIEFTEPVTVNWNGNNIATIDLSPSN